MQNGFTGSNRFACYPKLLMASFRDIFKMKTTETPFKLALNANHIIAGG